MMTTVNRQPLRLAVLFLLICCFLIPSAAPAAADTTPAEPQEASSGLLEGFYQDLLSFPIDRELRPCYFATLLTQLYLKNPDAREFCNRYLELRNEEPTADLSAYADLEGVPLFLQWDLQWGYFDYGGNLLGLSGCGPTTLAMAAYHFTGDPNMNPLTLAQFALDNGYRYPGNGTAWSFMTQGARQLGLHSRVLGLSEWAMADALENGELIICIMGPGKFTANGHYILLTGYEDGAFTVNDCNSITRSQRTWTYDEICGEILNLWAISG